LHHVKNQAFSVFSLCGNMRLTDSIFPQGEFLFVLLPESVWGNLSLNKYFIIGGFLWLKIVENALTLLLFSGMIKKSFY